MKLFQTLYGNESSAFLYESLEAHGGRGRYSFIGAKPRAVFRCRGDQLELRLDRQTHTAQGRPLDALRRNISDPDRRSSSSPFCGGAVGYMSYDTVRWAENIPDQNPDDIDVPDAHFLFPREIICFDHRDKLIHILLYQSEGLEQRLSEIKTA